MNKTELLGFEWLIQNGYSKEDIKFCCNKSPDFICSDGKRYEVKSIDENSEIVFYSTQIKTLKKEDIILVFNRRKYVSKFLWKNKKNKFPFKIRLKDTITIQIPREVLYKLQELRNSRETYAQFLERIINENKDLNSLIHKIT